jgi:hypothetical protein
MNTLRRSGRFALTIGVLAALLLPAAALAAYPPGPFPGPAPVGAFPVVVVSTTVCGAGQVTADDGTATVTVNIPAGAFADCTQVTVYGMSGDALGQLLPNGQTLIRAYAVGWDGPAAASLTLTVKDPTIDTDSLAYRTAGSGLVADDTASVKAGRGSTDVLEPAGFVLAMTTDGAVAGATDPPAPETSTDLLPANEPTGAMFITLFVILGAVGAAGVILVGWRRVRSDD